MPADLKESSLPLAEISQAPNSFESFLDRNAKSLVVLSLVICLGAVIFVVYRAIEQSKEKTAGVALVKAKDISGYQSVIDTEKNTQAAGSAMLLLANSQWSAGKQDESIATLRKFMADYPAHPAISTAKTNLGTKLISQGKTGDAAKILEEVVADPAARYIAPLALISLGDIAKVSGDLEKAETSYNQVKTQFPGSDFNEDANRRIAVLKTKAPVEIDPPVAPPSAPSDPNPASPNLSLTPGAAPFTPEIPNVPLPGENAPAPGEGQTTPEP